VGGHAGPAADALSAAAAEDDALSVLAHLLG
jgi:hypothetical protein